MVQTRPHYSFFEAARDGQEHSTLEVEQPALEVDDSHHDPNSYHPKGVDEGAVNDSPVGWHEKEGEDTTITATKKPLYRRKRFIVLGIALLLILVGAVVGGAVGGTLSHKNNRTSSQELSNSTTSSTHSSPSTTSPTLSSQIGTVVPTSSPSTAPFISNLASVSYTDQDNVPQRRLYHQDSKGILKESAWNGSDQEWYISTEALALAKTGSPLAAARTPDPDGVVSANSDQASGFMLTGSHLQQLNVYCVSPDGHLIEIYLSSDGWNNGSLTARQITPSPGSNIAAMWQRYYGCEDCYGTPLLVAYEDSGNAIQFGNLSSSEVQWTTLRANPMPGSGLAFNLLPRSDGSAAFRLYYQINSGGLVSIDYETRSGESDTSELFLEPHAPLRYFLILPGMLC